MRLSITENNSFVTLLACFPSVPFSLLCSTFYVVSSLSVSSHSSPDLNEGWGQVLFSPVSPCVTKTWGDGPQPGVFIGRKGTVGSRVKGLLVYSTSPLTIHFAVIIAAGAGITPHLKLEREQGKWGGNLPQNTKLRTHKQCFVSFLSAIIQPKQHCLFFPLPSHICS